MDRLLLWVSTAFVGGIAVLMTTFAGLSVLLVAVPLLLLRDRWVALSGFLTGVGVLWTGLIVRQLTAGAERDGLVLAALDVGVVLMVVGTALTSLLAIRTIRAAHHST